MTKKKTTAKGNFDYNPRKIYGEIFTPVDDMTWESSWTIVCDQFSEDENGVPSISEGDFRDLCNNLLEVTWEMNPECFDEDFEPPEDWVK
jgi:hypothetical protein